MRPSQPFETQTDSGMCLVTSNTSLAPLAFFILLWIAFFQVVNFVWRPLRPLSISAPPLSITIVGKPIARRQTYDCLTSNASNACLLRDAQMYCETLAHLPSLKFICLLVNYFPALSDDTTWLLIFEMFVHYAMRNFVREASQPCLKIIVIHAFVNVC